MEILVLGVLCLIAFLILRNVFRPILQYFGIVGRKQLDEVQVLHLSKYSPYYRNLKSKYKKEFRNKVAVFIASKEFIPRHMEAVTEEMKTVVASFAVQITFGLPHIYLSHFERILIYPTNYYSTINKTYHKGEVNPRFGIIVLSWDNLVQGIANETDGVNLGLHELAHAIHLENRIKNEDYGFLDETLWKQYLDLAHFEMFKVKEGHGSMFRSSAGIDHYEFFAVLLESFFEKPQALKTYSPILYHTISLLLKQDPLQLLNLKPY